MASRWIYIIGILLIATGIAVDVATGGDGGWRIVRSVLIGGGTGAIFTRFLSDRRRRKEPRDCATLAAK